MQSYLVLEAANSEIANTKDEYEITEMESEEEIRKSESASTVCNSNTSNLYNHLKKHHPTDIGAGIRGAE